MFTFNRTNFFPLNKSLYSYEIKNLIDKHIISSNIVDNFKIIDISSIENLKNNSILFLNKDINFYKKNYNSVLIITSDEQIYNSISFKNKIFINNFNEVYSFLLNYTFVHDDSLEYKDDFISERGSFISKYAQIDNSASIQENCVIGRGVKIGKNVIIKNNTVIKNAIISDNAIICENTTIGSSGFGFDLTKMGSTNILPQIGIVYIDENVLIGSNCTIDRAKIDYTYIGKNSMLDNLIHIAHNVILGSNACIAAQSGISGSVIIGKNLICGGQVGIAGHIKIGNNVKIAAKSGVTKNIADNSTVAGFPATDIKLWKKRIINERKN